MHLFRNQRHNNSLDHYNQLAGADQPLFTFRYIADGIKSWRAWRMKSPRLIDVKRLALDGRTPERCAHVGIMLICDVCWMCCSAVCRHTTSRQPTHTHHGASSHASSQGWDMVVVSCATWRRQRNGSLLVPGYYMGFRVTHVTCQNEQMNFKMHVKSHHNVQNRYILYTSMEYINTCDAFFVEQVKGTRCRSRLKTDINWI